MRLSVLATLAASVTAAASGKLLDLCNSPHFVYSKVESVILGRSENDHMEDTPAIVIGNLADGSQTILSASYHTPYNLMDRFGLPSAITASNEAIVDFAFSTTDAAALLTNGTLVGWHIVDSDIVFRIDDCKAFHPILSGFLGLTEGGKLFGWGSPATELAQTQTGSSEFIELFPTSKFALRKDQVLIHLETQAEFSAVDADRFVEFVDSSNGLFVKLNSPPAILHLNAGDEPKQMELLKEIVAWQHAPGLSAVRFSDGSVAEFPSGLEQPRELEDQVLDLAIGPHEHNIGVLMAGVSLNGTAYFRFSDGSTAVVNEAVKFDKVYTSAGLFEFVTKDNFATAIVVPQSKKTRQKSMQLPPKVSFTVTNKMILALDEVTGFPIADWWFCTSDWGFPDEEFHQFLNKDSGYALSVKSTTPIGDSFVVLAEEGHMVAYNARGSTACAVTTTLDGQCTRKLDGELSITKATVVESSAIEFIAILGESENRRLVTTAHEYDFDWLVECHSLIVQSYTFIITCLELEIFTRQRRLPDDSILQRLEKTVALAEVDGNFRLALQSDGNLVQWDTNGSEDITLPPEVYREVADIQSCLECPLGAVVYQNGSSIMTDLRSKIIWLNCSVTNVTYGDFRLVAHCGDDAYEINWTGDDEADLGHRHLGEFAQFHANFGITSSGAFMNHRRGKTYDLGSKAVEIGHHFPDESYVRTEDGAVYLYKSSTDSFTNMSLGFTPERFVSSAQTTLMLYRESPEDELYSIVEFPVHAIPAKVRSGVKEVHAAKSGFLAILSDDEAVPFGSKPFESQIPQFEKIHAKQGGAVQVVVGPDAFLVERASGGVHAFTLDIYSGFGCTFQEEEPGDEEEESNVLIVIGAAAGGVAAMLVALVMVLFRRRRRRHASAQESALASRQGDA